MKRSITIFVIASALLCSGCAREYSADTATQTQDAFNAWVKIHYNPSDILDTTALGCYILTDIPGTGAEITDSCYTYLEYHREVLETGAIDGYTSEQTAKLLGKYSESSYYGPRLQRLEKGSSWAGITDMVKGGPRCGRMREGGTRTVIMPGWLTSSTQYDSAQDYVKNITGTNYIYTLVTRRVVEDPIEWQIDSIKQYLLDHRIQADTTVSKSIFYGTVIPGTETKFSTDTTIYINYTGRLLNGRVFDTTNKDTAKVWGIYSASNTYEPVQIKTAEDSTAFTMGSSSSSVITGFSLTIHKMHPFETGVGVFASDYGYKETGSGETIPPYSPLVFEIEVVKKPE